MSDTEARDAYVAVEVELPNRAVVRGKPISFKQARELMLLSDAFAAGGAPDITLYPLLERFEAITGITEDHLLGLCPDLTMGELIDLVNRFFYSRRPAATPAPGNGSPPAAKPGT